MAQDKASREELENWCCRQKNRQPNNAIAMHQLAANDDNDQLKAKQINQPFLEILAPLTTEDYRPAPPPPRVNRHLAVTHTEIGPIRKDV